MSALTKVPIVHFSFYSVAFSVDLATALLEHSETLQYFSIMVTWIWTSMPFNILRDAWPVSMAPCIVVLSLGISTFLYLLLLSISNMAHNNPVQWTIHIRWVTFFNYPHQAGYNRQILFLYNNQILYWLCFLPCLFKHMTSFIVFSTFLTNDFSIVTCLSIQIMASWVRTHVICPTIWLLLAVKNLTSHVSKLGLLYV